MDESTTHLSERRKKYDTARKDYSSARTAAHANVEDITRQLKRIIEQLECTLPPGDVSCLKSAQQKVHEDLVACGQKTGCCAGDCDFDETYDGKETPDLYAEIKKVQAHVTATQACFDKLADEPTQIPVRVAALKGDVDKLSASIASDPKDADPRRWYATALYYQRRRTDIWIGFKDVNDYVDCLCQALNCLVKGYIALAGLYGELAVRECRDKKRRDRCDWLQNNVVEQILAECLREEARTKAESAT
jgi:hypothetical protein